LRPKLKDLKQICVAAVSYLNTKPLLYGIRRHALMEQITLVEDYPASIARMLVNDEVDLALIPVAIIPALPQAHIITDYCIGATGPVASVCIFSEVPMEQMTEVFLDYQSRTSVALARILLRDYWKKKVRFVDATGDDFRLKIKGTTAGVVIGDRALQQRNRSAYVYDLAAAWIDHTGLPFVFAAWISNKPLPPAFIAGFNEANALGLTHIKEVLAENPYDCYDLKTYYTKNISYELTENKRKGLALFLEQTGRGFED
jgi:chorismate dehydratase